MKFTTALISVSLLLPWHALAAPEYDKCVQEEKALRTHEKERCSGLSYLLNPSGCFAAQKALKSFENSKCREIIGAGKVKPEPNPPPAVSLPTPAPVPPPGPSPAPGNGPEQECDRLKAENARLKAEIDRLRAEMEQLGKRQGARP